MNILRASIKAMHLAIDGLSKKPQFLLIDGNRFFPYKDIKHKTIIKGDGLFFSIAAASVLAKTFRDDYMEKIHSEFPEYGWNKNKGYATLIPPQGHYPSMGLPHITESHSRFAKHSFQLISDIVSIQFISYICPLLKINPNNYKT